VTPALAQEKTFELKISHWVPASHPLQKALEDQRRGRKSIRRYDQIQGLPGQQLGRRLTIRHGARRHCRRYLRQPAISPAVSRLSAPANCHS
jgi:hypothetical protein